MLVEIEDLLLARAQAILGTTLRAYLPLPGGLGQLAQVLGGNIATPPCVFAAWRGSERPSRVEQGRTIATINLKLESTWSLLAVTQHPAGELRRRRGETGGAIGSYAIAEHLAQALHLYTLPGIGTLNVTTLGPLDGPLLSDLATSLTEVRLTLAHDLGTPSPPDLGDFLHFEGEFDVEPADGSIDAIARLVRTVDEPFIP